MIRYLSYVPERNVVKSSEAELAATCLSRNANAPAPPVAGVCHEVSKSVAEFFASTWLVVPPVGTPAPAAPVGPVGPVGPAGPVGPGGPAVAAAQLAS